MALFVQLVALFGPISLSSAGSPTCTESAGCLVYADCQFYLSPQLVILIS